MRLFSLLVLASSAALLVPASAQTAPAVSKTTGQVQPGATATISPTQGVTAPAPDKPHGILNSALTPKTRQTLQDAMNSVPPPATPAATH